MKSSHKTEPIIIIQRPSLLPNSPAYVHDFYQAIGRFALTWGRMEQHLDNFARIAVNIYSRIKPEPPLIVNLKSKLDQLKLLCRDCRELKQYEAAIRKAAPIIKDMGRDRDFLTHSVFGGFKDGPPPKIILKHVEHPKGYNMRIERGEFTIAQIDHFTADTFKIHLALIPMIENIVGLQDPEKVRKAQMQARAADPMRKPILL